MPSVSPEFLGMFVVVVMAMFGWWYSHRAHQRAEEERHEPRHEPPLHRQFATREELAALEMRINERLDKGEVRMESIEKKMDEHFVALQRERSSSVRGLHERIEELGAGMTQRIGSVAESLAELRGEIRAIKK